MNKTQVAEIVKQLEDIRTKPSMYLAGPEILAATRFIYGFNTACRIFGLHGGEYNQDTVYQDVLSQYGLKYSPRPIWLQMEDKGLDEATIIENLFKIESEIWRKRYQL